jgi:hypothetical protein
MMATAAPNIDLGKAVKAYGSFTKLAERLGLRLSTVHGWHLRKSVPDWRAKELAAVAAEDGHNILKKKRRAKAR